MLTYYDMKSRKWCCYFNALSKGQDVYGLAGHIRKAVMLRWIILIV